MATRRGWGQVKKLPSKRYQASYVHNLVRYNAPSTFTAKADAEGWLTRERQLIERDEWTPPAERRARQQAKQQTLREYSERWMANKTKLTVRTREGYESKLRRHIYPKLGDAPLRSLTPAVIREWHAGLDTGPTATAHAYALLHAILETATDDELLPANPCRLKGQMRAKRKKQPVLLGLSEVGALADAVPQPRFRALVLLAAWCGPRWGEVAELRRRDLDEGCTVLTVARAVTHRVTEEGRCHIGLPKDGEERRVAIPPHIRQDLLDHLEEHVGSEPDSLLFVPSMGGCHLDDKTFRDSYFIPACRAVGRDGVKAARPVFHDLRHFAGTWAAQVGTMAEVQARLGHSTFDAAMTYQNVSLGADERIAQALSALLASEQAKHL